MPAHEVYDYAVVRVMPRVEREEFVNAGVIISCQRTGHLQAAIALDEARLLALDPNVDMETVHRHLGAIVAICEGAAHGAIGRGALTRCLLRLGIALIQSAKYLVNAFVGFF